MARKTDHEDDHRQGYVRICRPWITRGGKRVYARQYGLKAFCFWVPAK